MAPARASTVLNALGGLSTLAALGFLWAARTHFRLPLVGGVPLDLVVGGLSIFVALAGPLRVVLSGVLIPEEVRRFLAVLGGSLLTGGSALTLGSCSETPWIRLATLLVCALCCCVAAWFGLRSLSLRLPDTFYIHEMLAIIKSAGLMGTPANSVADREFSRWCGGKRNGVARGQQAPDGTVLTLEGQCLPLSSFFQSSSPSLPLVLNFGSYSCPHHRKRIPELHTLMEEWEDKGVRFLTIYTAEAHPEDGWRLSHQYAEDQEYTGDDNDFRFLYALTEADRRAMAQRLIDSKSFRMPVVLDNMENTLLTAYNSWPIRLYVICNGKVVYTGKQGPFGYEPREVDSMLRQLSANTGALG